MLRVLVIGDVHAKVDELEDCQYLDNRIHEVAQKEQVDSIVYLGDLYDQFAVKNVVVERWWREALSRYPIPKTLLLGNHDRPGDASAVGHSLQAHADQSMVLVADRPMMVMGGIVAMPFFFKAEDFVAACNAPEFRDAKTVLCHQSFIGGKYESGQPIEARHDASAVDPASVPQPCIIAGHIHTPQTASKVWYVGAPRWRNNVSDANVDRFIYVIDFDGGLPTAVRKYATGDVCRRIWRIHDTEGQLVQAPDAIGKAGDRYVVDITGSAAYIEQHKKVWSQPGTRIRTFQTDRPGPKLSEAQGVSTAWGQWTSEYQPRFGTDRATLVKMAKERLSL
jgi:DNA repair exonuclease SbcCD nuclease subunit